MSPPFGSRSARDRGSTSTLAGGLSCPPDSAFRRPPPATSP
jgi:hypothetical protein